MRKLQENPKTLMTGERVRIYLGHGTDTEIHIREGVVEGHVSRRKWGNGNSFKEGPALLLEVDKAGDLERRDPRDVAVFNSSSGYWVTGQVRTAQVRKKRTVPYFYENICGVETLPIQS